MNTFRPGPTARSALRIAGLLFALILAFSIAMAVPMVGASTEATVTPTDEPAAAPTDEPTAAPTDEPAAAPTDEPTAAPTDEPAAVPTDEPAAAPTDEPAVEPAVEPTAAPTDEPAVEQAVEPTAAPTDEPAVEPAVEPTAAPIGEPTAAPTDELAAAPTDEPTAMPTDEPTAMPTEAATETPTATATSTPTPSGPPTIASDKDDYPPGGLVTLTGANWQGDAEVRIVVNDDVGQIWRRDVPVTVAADGTIYDSFNLPFFFVANYRVAATGQQTGRVATTTFTDKPAANLDQCANLGTTCDTGTSSQWQNGNLGQSQATYFEGDSVPYRAVVTGLVAGATYTLKIEYDTTQSGKHALDYLTNFDRTETTADPCSGVAGVPSCASSTFPIPLDSNVSGGGVTQLPGQNFTIYNGTITGASSYTLSGTYGGNSSTSIIVTFTATAAGTSVLAWGGHIATRADWGLNNSAVAISGSPYHMRLTDFTCSNVSNCGVGNQDRSLSADAVIFPASITIIKDAVPDDAQDIGFSTSGGLSPASFSLDDDADGTLSNTQLYSNILVTTNTGNNYTIIEATVAGWTLSLANPPCVVTSPNNGSSSASGSTVSINLREGENLTCTFTNTRQAAHLIVIKHVVNDNGGTAVASAFTMSVTGNGPTPSSFPGAESPGTDVTVAPGSYSVSEGSVAGYTQTSASADCSGTIAAGQTKTCTITNNDQTAHLKLVKDVINDNGGTAVTTDFTLSAAGPTPISGAGGAESDVNAGSYNLSETSVAGYTASAWSCVGGTQNGASVTLALGESATCTINNDDQTAHLKLVKTVTNDNGGTASATDFTLSAAGPTPISGAGGAESDVNAGTYSLSETNVAGYTAGSWSCTGGSQSGSNIALAPGQSATCTINNNDNIAHLTLVKTVTNDNGGTASATDFTLSAAGPTPISGAGGADSDVDAGSYDLSETTLPGYTAGAWSCVGGTQTGSSVTLALGESATCTINNDDNTAHLTLIKTVTNDNGGTALTTDFTLSAAGPTPISGAGGATSDSTFDAGSYDLSETSMPGYTASAWVCVGGNQTDGDTVAVGLGEDVTCTITNDDDAPSLTLVKVVVNDNGGTAVESAWTLTAAGPTGFSGPGPSVSNGASFDTGTYSLSESGPAGYSASAWVCVGGTQVGSDITVGLGESATCTLTNSDQAPALHLRKVVVNNNGGQAVETDWTLMADGGAAGSLSGSTPVDSGNSFKAGTYDLSESGPSGYTASDWVCTGTGTQNDADTVTLGLGQEATCTITNDDNTAHLTLVKNVMNDNGGTAVATDWTLKADGTVDHSGAGGFDQDVNADTYALSESTGPAGYTAGSFDCGAGAVTSVTLALGESKTCTINNDDQSAHLTLVKTVTNDNGGTAGAGDFTLSAAGPTPISGAGGAESDVNAGSYTLSETTLPGYTAGSWSCTDGTFTAPNTIVLALGQSATCTINNDDQQAYITVMKVVNNDHGGTAQPNDFNLTLEGNPVSSGVAVPVNPGTYATGETQLSGYTFDGFSGDCDANGAVTVALGESKTCTLTNNDQQAYITVVKVVTNDNGGSAAPDDFALTLESNPVSSGVAVPVNPGTYTAGETQLSGYTFEGFSGDCDTNGDMTVALGESKTCTLTNNDQQAYITVVKVVTNDNGGTALPDDFALTLEGNAVSSGVAVPVNPGTYTAGETQLSGYTFEGFSGDCDVNGDTTVALGESKTCTLTNNDQPATLTVIKHVINDNGGSAVAGDFTMNVTGSNPSPASFAGDEGGTSVTLDAGSYSVSETGPSGYTRSDSADCTGTIANGETKTCTVTNDDQAATLTVIKHVINDNGGTKVASDFTMHVTGDNASPADFPGAEAGTSVTLDAGSYLVSEDLVGGYTPSFSADCIGTIANGETKTCTITNDDQAATLIVIKHVINDNGGTALASDFMMDVSGNNATPALFPGAEAPGTQAAIDAGNYAVFENGLNGYVASFSTDCSGMIAIGETKTCTITNDDIQPKLIVIKHVVNDNGGTATAANFTIGVTGSSPSPASFPGDENGTTVAINAGNYNVAEGGPIGYAVSFLAGCASSIAIGETKTCTITNDDIAPKLHLRKVVVNDSGGTATVANFTLTANGTGSNDLSGTSPVDSGAGLKADTWALSENNVYGYSASAWVCVGGTQSGSIITVGIGDEATCTITNDDQPGTIVVQKIIKPVGSLTSFSFNTTGTGYTTFSLAGGQTNSQTLNAGSYSVKELVPLGWVLTGIGGSSDPNTPYNCTITGSGGSTGVGDLTTQTATISLKNGDTVTCVFENTGQGVTRTQGFWATHTPLANIAWFGGTAFGHTFPGVAATAGIGDNLICGRPIDTLGKLMGAFWSDISKTSTGTKRSALDQARMQLLQQLIAAELNASAFGSVPIGGSGRFATWESALCGTSTTAIKNAQQEAASFNTQGDSGTFTPGTSADSKNARAIATYTFWDVLP